jgi:hypothetical protein
MRAHALKHLSQTLFEIFFRACDIIVTMSIAITADTEYVPIEYLTKRYGVSHKTVERLLQEIPELHEVNLTRPGKDHGRRIVHWPSFKAFIEGRRVPKEAAAA